MVNDYAQLVARRKGCRACVGLTNPSEVDEGSFDSDHIGPWTRWQGNLSAELMVVGQDWGDTQYFRRFRGWDDERNPTNRTLMRLLESIGISIGSSGPLEVHDVAFFTNAILCLKEGGLQSAVQPVWFSNCASFLRRQVEIVAPKVVAPLGSHALQAVRSAFDLPLKSLATAVADPQGDIIFGNTRVIAVSHCGARVLNKHRKLDQQLKDWARIGRVLRSEPGDQPSGEPRR